MREAFGVLNTDWREGINWQEVREWRLRRAREAMARHELGAMLLMYDENIRYVTSTLTPGWNQLKPGLRYAVLVENWIRTCAAECAKAHAPWFPQQREAYGPALAELLDLGATISADAYTALEREREAFRNEFDELLTGVDALIAPAMPFAPPSLEAMQAAIRGGGEQAPRLTFTAPFDYSGHPTVTLPAGLFDNGLPQSVQLIGRRLDETTLLRAAFALEQSLQFSEHPSP